MTMEPISFSEGVKRLARIGIRQQQIYFIDLVLLCEMAWADGTIQQAERDLLFCYLDHHVDSINRLAGTRVLERREARDFIVPFLETRPDPLVLETIREVIPAIRINSKEAEVVEQTRLDILNACLDIAASSVTRYPYGLKERFTTEEKEYYHQLTRLLCGLPGQEDANPVPGS